ncbi:MAG: ATP-binding cassette domain-containing protein, partial [Proteobacteria bacterium]|nr:ATP-binding cassette domain-containing protein [Pseudomonadota bacterium]
MDPILEVKNLTMDFGGLRALDHLDLDVRTGEIVALIGPNGAGKTTFFNCITGLHLPVKGDMSIFPPGKKRKKLNGLKPNNITACGLARTFQNIRLFPNMTVLENVMIGRHCRMSSGILGAIFRNKSTVIEEEKVVEDSYAMLEKFGLADYVNDFAKNLPYGAQRRLEI